MTYDLAPDDQPPPAPPDDAPHPDGHTRLRPERSPVIDTDLPCVRCGYNLRTLDRKGHCPECGLPVLLSIGGDSLAHASPRWLCTVQRGLDMMIGSTALAIPLAIARQISAQGLAIVLEILVAALGLYGVLCFTAVEPRETLRPQGARLQTVGRVLGVLQVLCAALSLGRFLDLPPNAVSVAAGLGAVLSILLLIFVLVYMQRLMGRTDDVDLERETFSVTWGLAVSIALLVVFVPLAVLFHGGRSSGPPVCFSVVGSIGLVFFLLCSVKLLWRYHDVLRWAALEARRQQEQ
jgi:hypothetical protein